jgi:tRNA1Val (adenine37-N6)-methyltransferase
MAFRFKQFSLEDDKSTMKVGTDAVLLGAWVNTKSAASILDIGTGCGVIALMMAQRSRAKIVAIDIDAESARQAESNFKGSPWKERLESIHISLEDFAGNSSPQFDLIVSNPPYFLNALKPNSLKKKLSRHIDPDSFAAYIKHASGLLHKNGRLSMINPVSESAYILSEAMRQGLYPQRRSTVIARQGKAPGLVMIELGREQCIVEDSKIVILDGKGQFTSGYKELTRDFYLDF